MGPEPKSLPPLHVLGDESIETGVLSWGIAGSAPCSKLWLALLAVEVDECSFHARSIPVPKGG